MNIPTLKALQIYDLMYLNINWRAVWFSAFWAAWTAILETASAYELLGKVVFRSLPNRLVLHLLWAMGYLAAVEIYLIVQRKAGSGLCMLRGVPQVADTIAEIRSPELSWHFPLCMTCLHTSKCTQMWTRAKAQRMMVQCSWAEGRSWHGFCL